MNSPARIALTLVAVTAAVSVLSACGAPLGRSGAPADPYTLTSTWGNGPGGIGSDVLSAIVASDVAPEATVSEPLDDSRAPVDDYEGATITLLQEGEVDLSVVRADRLVMAGAQSLAPLQAPLSVLGPDHAAAIAASPIAEDLMAGLSDIGLVGVAIVPGGTRRIFGYHEALLEPSDFGGTVVNTRVGPDVDAIFSALGAQTEHTTGQERTERAAAGTSRGIEVSLQQVGAVDLPAVLTTNIDLYTKFDVVVVRKATWESLTSGQRAALREKVADGVKTAQSERPTDAEALAKWCGSPGASTATATDAQLAGITKALASVTNDMRRDPAAADALDRFAELAPASAPDELTGCELSVADGDYRVEPVGSQTVLDGTWRLEIKLDNLLAAGMPRAEALANVGIWTFKIADGRGVVDQPRGEDCTTQFTFAGEEFSFDWDAGRTGACYGLGRGTYQVDGNRAYFEFTAERDYDPAWDTALFAEGLVRIE